MALDITSQSWWLSAGTPYENQQAMEDYLVANYDPMNLSDAETNALLQFSNQIDMLIKAHVSKVAGFNIAKGVAIGALDTQHNQERIDLIELWQTYENNDYTVG